MINGMLPGIASDWSLKVFFCLTDKVSLSRGYERFPLIPI